MTLDWSITCCNDQQFLSIFLIIGYAILIFKLYARLLSRVCKALYGAAWSTDTI